MSRRTARVFFLFAWALLAGPLRAADEDLSTPGSLGVRQDDGTLVEMPLRHTNVDVEISAFVARASIEQVYVNPFDVPVEAVYTFPLGARAAVDRFELIVGERVVRGEIRRREEAREVYESARRAGYQAALLEQDRPNIFTQSVSNLEPGEEIRVRIRTVETLPYEAGSYQWTFPLVVGPRYVPGGGISGGASGRVGPVALPPGLRSGHDIDIRVRLDAGVPIGELASPSHTIVDQRSDSRIVEIRLDGADRIPNKDFILRWNVSAEQPAVGVLAHRDGVDGYFTLLIQPKGEIETEEAAPKELILVLDTSGSMQGRPLTASKRFVRRALKELGPRDTFNLVRFSSDAEVFSGESRTNDPQAIDEALDWVERLHGKGGTEMLTGLRAAFGRPIDPDRLRLVLFLTDGFIGNEEQLLAGISDVVGEARIYTLGIGSSVNHHLLEGMAEIGRGAYTFFLPDGRQKRALEHFRSWISKPYLTDIEIDWGALPVLDLAPARPRDLFSGQTLRVVGRYVGAGEGELVIRGLLGGRYWEQRVDVTLPHEEPRHAALASVWARQRIAELSATAAGRMTPPFEAEITALALEFGLMSRFTSFVAVDDSRRVNTGGPTETVRQAVPLPKGLSLERIFGPQGPPALREPDEAAEPAQVVPRRTPTGGGSGGLTIRVVDTAGPLPGAMVTLGQSSRRIEPISAMTDAQGRVVFPDLPPEGRYDLEVSFPGFGTRRMSDLGVPTDEGSAITVQLAEMVREHVKVVAQGDVVDLTRTSSSTKFSNRFVQDLPVPGRFYQNVTTLAPGVQDADGDGNPNVHGSRERDFKVLVRGVSNVDPLTGQFGSQVDLNSIEEMEVITSGTSVEFGARREHLAGAAFRLLADLAEDGRLSRSEGVPALAALLAAQSMNGAVDRDLRLQSVVTWALAEAAAAWPRDAWLKEASARATSYLSRISTLVAVDAETTRWVSLVLHMVRPEQCPEAIPAPGEASRSLRRLVEALAAPRTGPARGVRADDGPFDRLVGSIPLGHLKVAG